MKVITVVGTRPQFIKLGAIFEDLEKMFDHKIINTDQHYDSNLSDYFFRDLQIKKPEFGLNVGSFTHGKQTALMLERIEEILLEEKPAAVVIFGDTNSTLAAALVASKLLIPLFHIEAGCRCFNKAVPEEQNRIVADHMSQVLFCTDEESVGNLRMEGITENVYEIGDLMYDAFKKYSQNIFAEYGEEYLLSTIHRQENTTEARLKEIFDVFSKLEYKIKLPLHPRTEKLIESANIAIPKNVKVLAPVGYIEMLKLLVNSSGVITDSGGLTKEAYFASKHCISLRKELEVNSLVDNGNLAIMGNNLNDINSDYFRRDYVKGREDIFGDGYASTKMVRVINEYLEEFYGILK